MQEPPVIDDRSRPTWLGLGGREHRLSGLCLIKGLKKQSSRLKVGVKMLVSFFMAWLLEYFFLVGGMLCCYSC